MIAQLAGLREGSLEGLRPDPAHLVEELTVLAAVGQGTLEHVQGRLGVLQLLVDPGELDHHVDVRGVLGECVLEPRPVALQLLLGPVAALGVLQGPGLVLIDDLLPAVRHRVVARGLHGRRRREVLARLQGVPIARIGLEGTLVVLERLRRLPGAGHHRAGPLQALRVAWVDLCDELEDGEGRAEVARRLQRDPEEHVRLDVEGRRREIGLAGLRRGVVLAGLGEPPRHRQRASPLDHLQEPAALLDARAGLQGA